LTPQSDHNIVISTIGDFEADLFESLGHKISRVFGCPAKEMSLLQDLSFAFDQGRNQYHSTLILEELANRTPDSAMKILAITDVDLFIPILTYVYGEAQLNGKACIISTSRLKKGLPLINTHDAFLSRVSKEAIHELGHTFNLLHCPDNTCIMHYCRSENDVDRKSEELCRYCGILLEDALKKIQSA
jgi:archaemetzincin